MNDTTPQQEENVLIAQGATRTFKTDMAKALTGEQGALVKETIAKERNEENFKKSQTLASFANKLFFVFGIIICLATILFLAFGLKNYLKAPSVEVFAPIPSLVFFNNQENMGVLPTDIENLKKSLEEKYIKNFNTPNLTRLAFGNLRSDNTVIPDTTEKFLNVLNKEVPSKLLKGVNGFFEIGSIGGKENLNPFIIMILTGTDGSYQGMNDWEKTMASDLLPVFDYQTIPGDPLFFKPFEDTIIANQNVRVIRDEFGQDVLMWAIVGTKTVIITTNKESFIEILNRVHSSNNPLLQ